MIYHEKLVFYLNKLNITSSDPYSSRHKIWAPDKKNDPPTKKSDPPTKKMTPPPEKWSMLSSDIYKNLDEIILNPTYNN